MFACLAHQSSMQELDFLNPVTDPRITYTGGPKSYVGSDGLLHQSASNVLPLEYDPITLNPIGRSVWEQRTNLLTYSEQLQQWTLQQASAGVNAAPSPDGASTADALLLGVAGSWCRAQSVSTIARTVGAPVTFSKFLKAGPGMSYATLSVGSSRLFGVFDLSAGAVLFATANGTDFSNPVARIRDMGGGWYRCSITGISVTSAAQYAYVALSDGSNNYLPNVPGTVGLTSIYVWGAQGEAAAFVGPYIPTAGSQVTRVADAATESDLAAMRFNATTGTLRMAAIAPPSVAAAATLASLNDNTGSEVVRLHMEAGGALKAQVIDNGVTVADMTLGTLTANQSIKVAMAFAANDIAGCLNGGTVQTDTSATLPTVDRLMLGRGASGNYWNSGLVNAKLYPERLANGELQAITT